jgi:4-hydroxyphenylpyruvate dioxygenase-like putative hemolysin
MPHYRLYILDQHGATIAAVAFDAADDEAANERAEKLLSGSHRGELWRRVSPDEETDFAGKSH